MSYAYRAWIKHIRIGDKLPRGSFFRRRQPFMDMLKKDMRHTDVLAIDRLYEAFGHYLDITGTDPYLNHHTTHPDVLKRDKQRYAHLIYNDDYGIPEFNAVDCACLMTIEWNLRYNSAIAFSMLHSPR